MQSTGLKRLKARLAVERDPRVREQMTTTLESNQQQIQALSELRGRMDRADLQMDHSLAALGTQERQNARPRMFVSPFAAEKYAFSSGVCSRRIVPRRAWCPAAA